MANSDQQPDPFQDLPADTQRVAQLCNKINRAIAESVGTDIWVAGEITGKRPARGGGTYFDLVDRPSPSAPPHAKVSVYVPPATTTKIRRDAGAAGISIVDGTPVRLRGIPNLRPQTGQFQLEARELDVAWTVGRQLLTRNQILATLRAEGVLDVQKARHLEDLALDIALITSFGSHAHADFEGVLRESGFSFRVLVFDTLVQGTSAPAQIVTALRASAQIASWRPSVVVCLRGGGSRTDLAAWDDPSVARAIAAHHAPVIVAVGHDLDTSVADAAAWRSSRTPTDAARFLVAHTTALADSLEARSDFVLATATSRLDSLDATLSHTPRAAMSLAAAKLSSLDSQCASAAVRSVVSAQRCAARIEQSLEATSARLAARASANVAAEQARIDLAEATASAADPARILARGFSVTRTADGRAVRTVDGLDVGDALTTHLAAGTVSSAVTRVHAAPTPAPSEP